MNMTTDTLTRISKAYSYARLIGSMSSRINPAGKGDPRTLTASLCQMNDALQSEIIRLYIEVIDPLETVAELNRELIETLTSQRQRALLTARARGRRRDDAAQVIARQEKTIRDLRSQLRILEPAAIERTATRDAAHREQRHRMIERLQSELAALRSQLEPQPA